MSWLDALRHRARSLFSPAAVERERKEEYDFHQSLAAADLARAGGDPESARYAARREFGNSTYIREEVRWMGATRWLDRIRQDLVYAARTFRHSPVFTFVAISSVALGIGANAAMFGVVDRLLFRPPALLKDPDRTHRVHFFQTDRGTESLNQGGQYARYADMRRWTTSFSTVAGFARHSSAVGVGEDAREMEVGLVSANFFDLFDAPPLRGRYFTEQEENPAADVANVAILSHSFWRAQYGERDVLGETLQIGPTLYTIIGVTPPGFAGLWEDRPPVAYVSLASYGAAFGSFIRGRQWWESYVWGWMSIVVKRKPGVSIEQANADLTQAEVKSNDAERLEQAGMAPTELSRPRGEVGPINFERGPDASATAKVATWVGGVSLIVLLIACANVANLLLARALRRKREIALRLAVGISRGRLTAQLLTESLLLAMLGAVVGLLVAHWGGALLRATLLPRNEAPGGLQDPRTIIYAFAAAILVGVITGLAPLLQVRRVNLTDDLKAGSREGTHSRSRLRTSLLVLQGALSVILLVGAGLFVRSLHNVQALRWGYDVDPILVVSTNMRGMTLDSAKRVELFERLKTTAQAMPEVQNASLQDGVPYWSTSTTGLYVEGIDSVRRLGRFVFNKVSPEYFETVGTRIVRGRGIEADDRAGAQRVVVVSEGMASVLWPGQEALGKCIRIQSDTMPCSDVVGIAENIKSGDLGTDPGYYYYVPAAQIVRTNGLFVRVRGDDAKDFSETVRRRLQAEMPGTAYVVVRPFSEIVGRQKQSWTLGATMFSAFGILALLLAGVGLYSVIAYNVTQRMHELGVRRALGAQARQVVRLVVSDGLRVVITGLIIGGAISLWAVRFVEPLLFKVSPRDPLVFGFVALVLLLVAVVASWVPALRASRVDPNIALRTD